MKCLHSNFYDINFIPEFSNIHSVLKYLTYCCSPVREEGRLTADLDSRKYKEEITLPSW